MRHCKCFICFSSSPGYQSYVTVASKDSNSRNLADLVLEIIDENGKWKTRDIESQDIGSEDWRSFGPSSCSKQGQLQTHRRLLSAISGPVLNISKAGGDSTVSMGNLSPCSSKLFTDTQEFSPNFGADFWFSLLIARTSNGRTHNKLLLWKILGMKSMSKLWLIPTGWGIHSWILLSTDLHHEPKHTTWSLFSSIPEGMQSRTKKS